MTCHQYHSYHLYYTGSYHYGDIYYCASEERGVPTSDKCIVIPRRSDNFICHQIHAENFIKGEKMFLVASSLTCENSSNTRFRFDYCVGNIMRMSKGGSYYHHDEFCVANYIS